MKAFAVLALAAVAAAEPQFYGAGLYQPTVYGHAGLTTYGQFPAMYNQYPYVYNQYASFAKPVKSIQASPGNIQTTIHKREAEADAYWPYTASTYGSYFPQAYAGAAVYPHAATYAGAYAGLHPAAYASHAATPFGVKSYSNDAVKPFNYANKGQYVAQSAGAIHVAKREAEADSQIITSPLAYSASVYPTTAYAANYYNPSVYRTPYTYNAYNAYNGFNGYYHF